MKSGPPPLHADGERALRLQRVLERSLSEARGVPVTLDLKPVVSHPWSEVFYADGGAYPTPVGVKVCLDPETGEPSPAAAAKTFEALTRAASLSKSSDTALVGKPFELFERLGVVVTEWMAGGLFSSHVNHASRSEALKVARDAGCWLGRMHLAGGFSRHPLDSAKALRLLDDELAKNPSALKRPAIARAVALLRATAPRIERSDSVWAPAHGDYKPDNLIVTKAGLYGIDVALNHEGPVIADAAHFLNHLALQFYTPGGLKHLPRARRIEAAFIEGYEATANVALARDQLLWRRLSNSVRLLLIRKDWTRSIKSFVSGLLLKRLIVRLTGELAKLT